MKRFTQKSGYTLIELAIVIVIISLILGGLFSSALIIKQAHLRSVINDFQSYKTAYQTFILTYKALPGDISYATKIFDSYSCATTADLCNGNGDGVITRSTDDTDEVKAAMKHLELAGLINGNLSQVTPGGTMSDDSKLIPGLNMPKSRMEGGGYMIINQYLPISTPGTIDVSTTLLSPFPIDKNILYIGKMTGNFDDSLVGGVMRGVDAYNIDIKLDDGVYATGSVRSLNGYQQTTCISGSAYLTTIDSLACVVGFSLE